MEWGVTLDDYTRCKQSLVSSHIRHFLQVATLTPMIQSQSQRDAPAMLTAPKIQTFSATKQMAYANQVKITRTRPRVNCAEVCNPQATTVHVGTG